MKSPHHRPRITPRNTPPHGFTIIEILVVVSIIVLLIAILLPALAGARKNAKKNVCLSNLKAVGEAVDQYQRNNNTYFPGPSFNGVDIANWNLMGGAGTAISTPATSRPLNVYLNNAEEVARCPLDQGSTDAAAAGKLQAWEALGTSYWYPDRPVAAYADPPKKVIVSGIWAIEGHRLTEIRQPAQKLVVADLIIKSSLADTEPKNQWHTSKDPMQVSITFADGHAELSSRKLASEVAVTPDTNAATDANIGNLLNTSRGYY